jgi:hypothetical protein
MDVLLGLLDNLDFVSVVVGGVAGVVVYLVRKLPAKVKALVVKVIDKTDAELDKDVE